MKTIYKYPFPTQDVVVLDMPINAQILSVQLQGGMLCLWAIVEPQAEREKVLLRIYATGQPLPANPGKFLNTVQCGSFVWHIFLRD